MRWREAWRVAPAVAPLALMLACAAPEAPPNVVLVVIDNLRADRLGAYGHTRPTSPVFDAWAQRGELFEHVQAASSWTKPSVASLFSSLEPEVHGAVSFGRHLRADVVTLAELFAAAGYATVGVTGNFVHVNEDTGLARGFEGFRILAPLVDGEGEDVLLTAHDPKGEDVRLRAPRGDEVNREVKALLPEHGGAPLFLYVHYMEPHAGWDPPAESLDAVLGGAPHPEPMTSEEVVEQTRAGGPVAPELRRRMLDLYDGEIAAADAALGALLDDLAERGWLESAVVAVVSDHGEEFGEHGGLFHARTLFGESLWVPLLIADTRPGTPRGRRSEPVDLLDVAPTLLTRAGIPVPVAMQGRDLTQTVAAREQVARLHCDPVFEAHLGPRSHAAAWLYWPWKAVVDRDGTTRWYDLSNDPAEQSPFLEPPPAVPARIAAQLSPGPIDCTAAGELSPESREALRALGYTD